MSRAVVTHLKPHQFAADRRQCQQVTQTVWRAEAESLGLPAGVQEFPPEIWLAGLHKAPVQFSLFRAQRLSPSFQVVTYTAPAVGLTLVVRN